MNTEDINELMSTYMEFSITSLEMDGENHVGIINKNGQVVCLLSKKKDYNDIDAIHAEMIIGLPKLLSSAKKMKGDLLELRNALERYVDEKTLATGEKEYINELLSKTACYEQ